MSTQRELTLSSKWTNASLYGGALLIVFIVPVTFLAMTEQKFHVGMVFGLLILLALVGFLIYQFIFACKAQLSDVSLTLKKQFRPAKSYSFDKICSVSSFTLKMTKYITLVMLNENGSTEKYLIINNHSLLSFEKIDAEQTLKYLQEEASGRIKPEF
jgi:hypothetical protein